MKVSKDEIRIFADFLVNCVQRQKTDYVNLGTFDQGKQLVEMWSEQKS